MFFDDRPFWFAGGRGSRGRHGRGGFGGWRGDGGGRGWPDLFGERPVRAERGNVRYLVLDAISETPRHGYEIMAVIEQRSGASYRPSPGVIYPTLQMLEELGHVKVSERDGKKVYAITPAGSRDLDEHREDVTAFYEQSEDVWGDHGDALHDVMDRVKTLMRAFARAARRGRLTPSRMAKVRTILDEAVQKLAVLLDE